MHEEGLRMIDIVVLGHKQGIRVFWALTGPPSLYHQSLSSA